MPHDPTQLNAVVPFPTTEDHDGPAASAWADAPDAEGVAGVSPVPFADPAYARHEALLHGRQERLARARAESEAAARAARRTALITELGGLPAVETPPDSDQVALAQLSLTVGITVAIFVATQGLFVGWTPFARVGAALLAGGAFVGVAGAAWNTHTARQGFFRGVSVSWAIVYLLALALSQGAAGLSGLVAVGATAAQLVSFIAAFVGSVLAWAAAVHVDGAARRWEEYRRLTGRKAAIEAELAGLEQEGGRKG